MDLLARPYVPEPWASGSHSGRVVAESVDGLWLSVPMAFTNFRLVGVPRALPGVEQDWCPWWGWCFPGELALLAAVRVWEPSVEDEPLGWHKRAGEGRTAPRRFEAPRYNRPRCVHGTYLDAPCCRQVRVCQEFPGVRGPGR